MLGHYGGLGGRVLAVFFSVFCSGALLAVAANLSNASAHSLAFGSGCYALA